MAPRMTNCGERTFIRADRARGVGSAAPCQQSQGIQGILANITMWSTQQISHIRFSYLLHDSLVALLPNHEKEILAFTKPDDFGYDVYDGLLNGIEYVYLQKAKCTINICGGSNSMEDTHRIMNFIKTIGGKPLTCKVQSDELEGIEAVKYTMDKNGKITENIVENSDWWVSAPINKTETGIFRT